MRCPLAGRSAKKTKNKLAQSGLDAYEAGDLPLAERYLTRALKLDRGNVFVRLCLADVLERLDDAGEAIHAYCEVLAVRPGHEEAVRRLSSLLRRFRVDDVASLNINGLKGAIDTSTPAVQLVVNTALRRLEVTDELAGPLTRVRSGEAEDVAAEMLKKGARAVLRNELLLRSLRFGKVSSVAFEQLLTAMRKAILLTVPWERMGDDKSLFQFILALIGQCDVNEYVWVTSSAERDALAQMRIDKDKLIAGDLQEAWTLGLQLLYAPFERSAAAGLSQGDVRGIRPKALAGYLETIVERDACAQQISTGIKRLSTPVDAIGQRVARHYEASPYPRWTGLQTAQPGALRRKLGEFFSDPALAFMDAPFDVLIAGCGTGQHACQAAAGYGDKASLMAIDISLASLTYAQRMAQVLGIDSVAFAQADIMDLKGHDKRYDIIESVGVLHHMADPFAGAEALVEKLKPNGLLFLGLYSQVSRRNIAALHGEVGYPGPDCTDDEARTYRQVLMTRGPEEVGHELMLSYDFYALNEFRDLVLNPNEHHLRLDDIDAFLTKAGLTFRGFTIDPAAWQAFAEMFPDDPWPGRLTNWAVLEEARPRTFDAMYRFWCQRA